MARINIEDSLFKKRGWMKLLIVCQDEDRAMGAVVRAYMTAQRFWVPDRKPIPLSVWKAEGLNDALVECGLAESREDGVYVKGSEDAFAWLFQAKEAGKASGAKRREKKKAAIERRSTAVQRTSTAVERDPTRVEPPPTSSSLSSSFSSSGSHSSSSSDSKTKLSSGGEGAVALPAEVRSPVGYFIATYVHAYQDRHGFKARPHLGGKVQGQIKRFLEDVPLERACAMIRTYCQMNDQWFLTKGHDFGTFTENLTKVALKLDTGQAITRTEAQQGDRTQANANVFEKLMRENDEDNRKRTEKEVPNEPK